MYFWGFFFFKQAYLFNSILAHLTMEVNFDAQEFCIKSNNMPISIMEASLHNAGQNLSKVNILEQY